jgi:hypothetical protein
MLYGFFLPQSEGGNFNYMEFLYLPYCIVFSMYEIPGSQISAAGNFCLLIIWQILLAVEA